MQRKKALNGDMSNYRCFADRYCTLTRYACGPWKEGESKFNIDFALQKCESKPALGLCCEVCCFCQQAALINHEMVWDESAVKTDPCELKLVRLANFDQVSCSGPHGSFPSATSQGKCQLLHPATPYYPSPRGKFHTRGNIWSFAVGWHECRDPAGVAGSL